MNTYAIIHGTEGWLLTTVVWDGNPQAWQVPDGFNAVLADTVDFSNLPLGPFDLAAPTSTSSEQLLTAEEWLESQGIGGARQPTLLYLRQRLLAASKESPLLNSLEQYLQTILALYANDPSPRSDWPLPPTTFDAAVRESMQQLNTP